jgi:hypothetical protein
VQITNTSFIFILRQLGFGTVPFVISIGQRTTKTLHLLLVLELLSLLLGLGSCLLASSADRTGVFEPGVSVIRDSMVHDLGGKVWRSEIGGMQTSIRDRKELQERAVLSIDPKAQRTM